MIVKLLTEHHLEFLIKRRLQRLVQVYTCQNVNFLEISCRDSIVISERQKSWKELMICLTRHTPNDYKITWICLYFKIVNDWLCVAFNAQYAQ